MNLITALPLISGVCWTITYAELVYHGFKDKTPGMPLSALCLNFAWEFTYALIFPPATSGMLTIINTIWMLLDIGILMTMILYGPVDYEKRFGIGKLPFYLMLGLGVISSFGVMILAPAFFGDLPFFHHDTFAVAKFIAYIQNLVMSILFVTQFYQRKHTGNPLKGQSFTIAWSKWLGTPLTVGMHAMLIETTGFYIPIIGLTLICDTWYMLLIYKEQKEHGINPWRLI